MKLLQCDRTLGIIMWWFTCALVFYGVMGVNNVSGTDNVCSLRQFQCANGRCIPHTWMCEGEDDCGDNSDETAKECHEPSGPRATPQPDKQSSVSSVTPPVITWTWHASPFSLVWNLISQNKTSTAMANENTTTVVPSLLTFYHVPVTTKEETSSAMPVFPSRTVRPTTVDATESESIQLVTESYLMIPSRISVTPPSPVVNKHSSEEDKNNITEEDPDDDQDISDEYVDDVKMDVLALVDLVKGRLMSRRTRPSSVRRPSSNSTVKSNSTGNKTTAAPAKQVDTGDLTIDELSELTENALRLRAARLNLDVLRRQSQMLREERRKLSAEREMLGASRDMFQAEMRRSQAERDRIMSEHQKLELERDMLQSQMLGRGLPVRSFSKA